MKNITSWKLYRSPSIGFWLGLLLAQGAPLGLFVHLYFFGPEKTSQDFLSHLQNSWNSNFAVFIYVWLGTSIYFSLFGWGIGRLVRARTKDLHRLESALELFARFDSINRQIDSHRQMQIKNPVASLLEIKEGLDLGFFGILTTEQSRTIKSFLEDIADLYNIKPLDVRKQYSCDLSFLEDLARKHQIKLSMPPLVPVLQFEKKLLIAALSEILLELSSQKVELQVETSPAPSWPDSGYAVISIKTRKLISHGPSWMIARHILTWYGGLLLEVELGYAVIVPLAQISSRETGAA